MVVSPEPTSLIDAYAAIKVFSQEGGVGHFAVIVNPVVDELAARDIYPQLTAVADRFLNVSIRMLGYVPRDENVHRAVMAQQAVVDLLPHSPASRAFSDIGSRAFQSPPGLDVESGLKFMWQRLLKESYAAAG